MDAEKIADEARDSISRFCSEECRAFCCRKCYLVLEEDEVDVVTQGRRDELESGGLLRRLDSGRYSLNMGTSDMPCPSLDVKTFRCRIHDHPKRPSTCRNFPLFIDGKNVMLSPRCLAVRLGMLYPFVARLKMMGYSIVRPSEYSDIELYSTEIGDPKDPGEGPGADVVA